MHGFGPRSIHAIHEAGFRDLFGIDVEAEIIHYNELYEKEHGGAET